MQSKTARLDSSHKREKQVAALLASEDICQDSAAAKDYLSDMEQQATHVEQQQEQQEAEDTPGPYPIEQLQVGTMTCG